MKKKSVVVVGLNPRQYSINDTRLNKPVYHQHHVGDKVVSSALLQDVDTVSITNKRKLTYFCPNNIAVLLSISAKALVEAKRLYKEMFESSESEFQLENVTTERVEFLKNISSSVCDYIEYIQTSIVFAYTTLETFANLSIPHDYQYKTENKSKGIMEIYTKEGIERWLSLKVKLQYILKDIYKCEELENQNWWGHFSKLEQYRNDIIHQKSITSAEFYKQYFKKTIFQVCETPLSVIKFFYTTHEKQHMTNPIWPWLANEKNHLPGVDINPEDIEKIGNIYEGFGN